MTEDGFKNFDLEVRSIMENAREEVPSRVWDSVSASLDGIAPRRRTVSLWWKLTAATVAVAAAVAVGVIFTGAPHNSNIQHISGSGAIAGTAKELPKTKTEKEEPIQVVREKKGGKALIAQAVPEGESINEKTIQADGRGENVPASAESVVATNSVSATSTSETSDSETTTVRNENSVSGTERTTVSSAGDGPDPFAAMEFQDSRKKTAGKPSISAGSNFETNSLDGSSISIRRRFLPTAGPAKTTVTELSESTYGIPLTFSLGVRFPLSPRVSIGTGIQYSMLSRSFRGTYTPVENGVAGPSVTSDINNWQHYIGVPVNVFCNLVNGESVMLYVFAGGTVEKGLTDSYRIKQEPSSIHWSHSVKGVQASAAVGMGVEFRLAKGFGIYIDPALRYYFDCNQPESIRTRQRLMMNLDLGLRFDIGR